MRWISIVAALALAGCGDGLAKRPEGTMTFSHSGEMVRLTYSRSGAVRYVLSCKEGSDYVRLTLRPAPPEGRLVRLRAGRGDHVVELRRPVWRDGEFGFHLQDSFLAHFLWAGGMTVDGEALEAERGGETAEARWRFTATCESAPTIPADPNGRRITYDLMSGLKVEDAAADARRAMSVGDNRLVTVTGYSRSAPGAPDHHIPEGRAWRDIDPTGDVVVSAEQKLLKDRAYRYAQVYNSVVLGRPL